MVWLKMHFELGDADFLSFGPVSASGSELGVGAGSELGSGAGSELGSGAGSELGVGAGSELRVGAGSEVGVGAGADLGVGVGAQLGVEVGAELGSGVGSQLLPCYLPATPTTTAARAAGQWTRGQLTKGAAVTATTPVAGSSSAPSAARGHSRCVQAQGLQGCLSRWHPTLCPLYCLPRRLLRSTSHAMPQSPHPPCHSC